MISLEEFGKILEEYLHEEYPVIKVNGNKIHVYICSYMFEHDYRLEHVDTVPFTDKDYGFSGYKLNFRSSIGLRIYVLNNNPDSPNKYDIVDVREYAADSFRLRKSGDIVLIKNATLGVVVFVDDNIWVMEAGNKCGIYSTDELTYQKNDNKLVQDIYDLVSKGLT